MKRNPILVAALSLLVTFPLFAGTDELLTLVPADAVSVGLVRIDELKDGELGGMLFEHTSEITIDGEAMAFLQEAGLDPMSDVDALLFAMLPREGDPEEAEVLLLIEGRFDPVRLGSAVARRGASTRSAGGSAYYAVAGEDEEGGQRSVAIGFPSRGLAVAGTEAAVVESLTLRSTGGSRFLAASNIGRDLGTIDRRAAAWAVMDVQRAARMGRKMTRDLEGEHADSFGKALRYVSTMGVWAAEKNGNLEFGGVALSSDDETRVLLEDVVRGITAAWRMAAREENAEWLPVIRSFEVRRDDSGVRISGRIPVGLLEDQKQKIANR